MKLVLVALLSYYAGVVAPLSASPFVILGLIVLVAAIAWANMLELGVDPRDRPVKYVVIPTARTRRSP